MTVNIWYISHGSVSTPLRGGGICSDVFIANFRLSVKWKNFENRSLFGEVMDKSGVLFFGPRHTVIYSLVAIPLTPKHVTSSDFAWLVWPFYVTYMFTVTNCHWLIICCLFTAVCLHYACDQRVWPAKKCGNRSSEESAEYLESAEKLSIFRGRYIVGTLTNNANIII